MNGPALKIHAGFISHPALQLLAGQVVAPAVLDEHGAGLDKAEGHVGIHTFLPERFDPIEIAGAGTIVVFVRLLLPGHPSATEVPEMPPDPHRNGLHA